MRKYYVLSGTLRVVILGESAEDAACRSLLHFGDNNTLGPSVAVNEAGFESLLYFDSNNPKGAHTFQTDYLMRILDSE